MPMKLIKVILDGFKTYGGRTEVTGFDSEVCLAAALTSLYRLSGAPRGAVQRHRR